MYSRVLYCGCGSSNILPVCYSPAPEEKAEPPQAMNALMRLNQLKPGLQYKLISQTGPVHVPVFTMAVEVDGKSFEASGPSKRTAKLHVAVKVSAASEGSTRPRVIQLKMILFSLHRTALMPYV